MQSHAPLIPSEIPEYPWQIIGSDLFQLEGSHYLLNVDYFSKWVNVAKLNDLSSKAVVDEFRKQFADFGQPATIRSDNGPQYDSREFKAFAKEYAFDHVTSSPTFARSNGQVERSVQTVKRLMVKATEDGKCFWNSLQMWRNTPLAGDLPSPAQLLQGRTLYDGIPLKKHCLFPRAYDGEQVRAKFVERQTVMKGNHDVRAGPERVVMEKGQNVRFRSLKGKWERAVVQDHHDSDRSYTIKNLASGMVIRRNRQQLRPDYSVPQSATRQMPERYGSLQVGDKATETVPTSPSLVKASNDTTVPVPVAKGPLPASVPPPPTPDARACVGGQSPAVRTRSGRTVLRPLRYRDE